MRKCLLFALLVLLLFGRSGVDAQSPSLVEVLQRANGYLREWFPQLANVVATETFEERSLPQRRRLTSDLLLVRYPGGEGWMMFRDVATVDGRKLPHDSNRLVKLFTEQTAGAHEQALRISAEGLQNHLPGATASVTNPLLGVALMQEGYQVRLRFLLGNPESSLGAQVQALHFAELEERVVDGNRESLPLLLPDAGRVSGTVWLDVTTGMIVKTEAKMVNKTASTSTTVFAREERIGIMLPREMQVAWRNTDGVAKYSNYRRFDVQTSSSTKPAAQ
jgi:hypothetical protein